MQFYPHRTVEEQAERLPEQLREAYRNSQLDRIKISDGVTELELTGYAEYSYLEEKSYKTQPVRTQDGAIPEIEEYATFLTPRLIIKYNMMHIDDYRSLMKMLKRKNAFNVTFYDVVEDKIVTHEMYVATPSMPIIYQQFLMALGIQEYVIELIGTNNPPDMKFYIEGTEYVTKSGTKWGEFAESVDFLTIESSSGYGYIVLTEDDGTGIFYEGAVVRADEVIVAEYNYVTEVW